MILKLCRAGDGGISVNNEQVQAHFFKTNSPLARANDVQLQMAVDFESDIFNFQRDCRVLTTSNL